MHSTETVCLKGRNFEFESILSNLEAESMVNLEDIFNEQKVTIFLVVIFNFMIFIKFYIHLSNFLVWTSS